MVTSEPAVQLRGLTHRYGDRLALSDVTLSVAPQEMFALLGPNGGGKTTLFKILSTLMTPTSGSASVFGIDVGISPREARRKIGVTFQSPSLDKKLTVRENLRHQGHLYALYGKILDHRINEVLETFNLSDRRDDRVEHLSGGMARRVEIAKCLIHQPSLLLLDEPSTGLDPSARRTLRELLETLRRQHGTTCFLTTHLMDDAECCDRVAILDEGKMVAIDTPRAMIDAIGGDVVAVSAINALELAEKIRARFELPLQVIGETIRIEREQGHEFAAILARTFPDELMKVSIGRPTLDDVFAKVTGHRFDQ